LASGWQRHGWRCAAGAGSDLSGAVLHRALDLELADMTIEFLSVAVLVAIVLGLLL
jgi:hypothetical protein